MNARRSVALSSLVLVCVVALGCTGFYEIPIETPIQPKMDVSPFQRVLVAGFISGGTDDVDANQETVRLLRSQLRTKSPLRVIEAEVLPLASVAEDQLKDVSLPPAADAPVPVPQLPAADVPAKPADPKAGTEPKCSSCRYGSPKPVVTEALRRWWLDRYSLDEIRELAAGLR